MENLDVKVLKMDKIPQGGRIKAYVSIVINEAILVKGIRLIDGKDGLFIAMPAELGHNDRWYERIRCITKTVHDQIEQAIINAFNAV